MPDAGTALGDGLQDAIGTLGSVCEGGHTGCRGRNALEGIFVLVVVVDAEHAVGAIAVKGYAHKQDKRSRTALPQTPSGSAAAGQDTDFCKSSEKLIGITDGPFYGCSYKPMLLVVLGGTRTNIDLQALDANDEPIPGLFNVGTMIGDFYSGVYTFAMEGMNYGATCITLPYLLGRDLAAGKFDE